MGLPLSYLLHMKRCGYEQQREIARQEVDKNKFCQGGYVFIGVSLFVCWLAGFCKNCSSDFHKICWKGGTWATEETIWW